jgi:origin recognition complex subunit 2
MSYYLKINFVEVDLYLIIHNIDGNNLRDANVQNMLSELASNNFIHILASVDHVNSSLRKLT